MSRIVHEKAILRNLISTATEIATRGYEEQGNVDEFLDIAERVIFDISERKIKAILRRRRRYDYRDAQDDR